MGIFGSDAKYFILYHRNGMNFESSRNAVQLVRGALSHMSRDCKRAWEFKLGLDQIMEFGEELLTEMKNEEEAVEGPDEEAEESTT